MKNNYKQPLLCFVTRYFGNRSEVWLWRQIIGLTGISPYLITWKYKNKSDYPCRGIPVNELLTFNPEPENAVGLKRWIFRLCNIYHLNFYGSVGEEKKSLLQTLRKKSPEVILVHFGSTALRILPIAKKLRIPIVAHFHGLDVSSQLTNKWYKWSLLRHAKSFTAIVVVGNHQKKWFVEQGIPENRIFVIPCGVPTEEFTPPCTKRNDILRFITVSRINKQKGISFTIRAFKEVAENIPNIHLDIVGDGPQMSSSVNLVERLALDDKVTFWGEQPQVKVKQCLALGHVFLQHSLDSEGWREGWGVSMAEAAAMELPVVATRCGGIPEQVEDGVTGFVVEQKDINGMAKAMLRLAKDNELREMMGKEGRQRMIHYFDTNIQISKLEKVLLDCCRK